MQITDEQWDGLRIHFPEESYPEDRVGRKPVEARRILDAILWLLNTGAQWNTLPQSSPNDKTVHHRFQVWCRHDVLKNVLLHLANELRDNDLIDTSECYIEATFSSGKGGSEGVGKTTV